MTKTLSVLFLLVGIALPTSVAAALPETEEAVADWFEERGARISRNDEGKAVKLFHNGKPEFSVEELALIGKLKDLEELALNAAKAGDGEWDFLRQLSNLKTLRVWHGHHFSDLESFAGIAAEDVLIGGCMGLRDLNRENPEALRDAVLTLRDLPNLKKLSLYHSPLTPDDSHLAHIVKEFPNLVELRVDFAAPHGQEIKISPEGLAGLAKLKLNRLALERAEDLTPAHLAALAKIETLETLHLYPPRDGEIDYEPLLAEFKKLRPEVEITFQKKPGS